MKEVHVFSRVPNLINELKLLLPLVTFREISPGKEEQLKEAEIIITDFDIIGPHLYELKNIKWIQGTWAGIDTLTPHIQPDKDLPAIITRFSGLHFGRMIAEYVFACIINHERDFHRMYENQKTGTWCQVGKIETFRIISDLKIGILGVGIIGNQIGRFLHNFGAKVSGYGRKPNLEKSDQTDYLSNYYTKATLPDFLKSCDYVINLLPSTEDSRGLLNGNVLENCKERKSVFINIGRGNIIEETDLINSLNKGWISHAILDVFDTEPLPHDNALWKTPNVTITPHVAGVSRCWDVAEQFRSNYQLYLDGKKIPTEVNFSKGY